MNYDLDTIREDLELLFMGTKSFRGERSEVRLKKAELIYHYRGVKAAKWLLKNGLLETVQKQANGQNLAIIDACLWLVEGGQLENADLYRCLIDFAQNCGWRGYEN